MKVETMLLRKEESKKGMVQIFMDVTTGETLVNLEEGVVRVRRGEEFHGFRELGWVLGARTVQKNVVVDLSRVAREWKAAAVWLISKNVYRFAKYKTGRKEREGTLFFADTAKNMRYVESLVARVAHTYWVRDLINEPANVITPAVFCERVAKEFDGVRGVRVTVMDDVQMVAAGMNLVLAVGQGSSHPPRFLVVEWVGGGTTGAKTVALVGKGVCFDSGGLNIKTGRAQSYEMKADKTGACIAVGLVRYFASVKLRARVVAVVPLVENAVGGSATRPGDIVKGWGGKTVEILDTDAEGRLILADALSYAASVYKPDYMLNFATLTGWASNLHCETSAVYLAPGKELGDTVETVGEDVGERVWGMPRWMDQMRYCVGEVADLKNVDMRNHGCEKGSGFMAAMFLAHFVPAELRDHWIHMDITNNESGHMMNAHSMWLAMFLIERLISNRIVK